MPLLLLLVLAVATGSLVTWLALRAFHGGPRVPAPVAEAAKAGREVARHPRVRAALGPRLDPVAATGLALTVALVLVIGGGVVLGGLAFILRADPHALGVDSAAADWGNRHATAFSTHGLNAVTSLGTTVLIIGAAAILAIADGVRTRSAWAAAFLLAVLAGEQILSMSIKDLADRARPTLNPIAATLGPSFPSGHSAVSAAFYAAAALVIGRHTGRRTRAVLAGVAVGIAVGVAASRVLLDVHWLTDVLAGLALGWAWFAVCAIAFGGRLLRFGVSADVAARAAGLDQPPTGPAAAGSGGAPPFRPAP